MSLQTAGDEGGWVEANLNRPLVPGDGLYSDRASRVEMEIGAATLRLDERSNFRVLNLDNAFAQIELTEGILNLNVRRVFEGESYEIDTPTLAFVIDEPGRYRVDIAPDGSSTMISVHRGGGTVYGEGNARYSVRDGQSYRFHDAALRDYEVFDLPRQDDFDRWCYQRDDRYERSVSRRYVSEEVIGYADLDDHGSWSTVETYGSIWYPSRVEAGWAPYRHGHWSWIDPWGWTWVDRSAWGFAPFHYGRWAYVGSRWGWVPGPRHVRPIYAPALVAFVGGSNFSVSIGGGGPVGWFPLGPRDVYVPWYRGSRDYFNNINVRNTTIINNTYITNVYNDYSRGRNVTNFNYAYRNNERAFTAVPRDAFVNARGVERSRLNLDRAQFGRGEVLTRVDVKPSAASFTGGAAVRNRVNVPSPDVARREVIARKAPAPRALGVQGRMQEIERNGNQPLAIDQMRQLSNAKPREGNARAERIRVVGNPGADAGRPQALPARGSAERVRRQPEAQEARPGRAAPGDQRITPIERPRTDDAGKDRGNDARTPVQRERRLPSSGYAPGRDNAERAGQDLPERRLSPRGEAAPVRDQPRIERPRDETQGRPELRERAVQPQREPRAAPERRNDAQREMREREVQQPRVDPQPRSAPQREMRQREVQQPRVDPQPRSEPQRELRQREVQQPRVDPQPRSAPQREMRAREMQQPRVDPQAQQRQREMQQQQQQQRAAPPQQRAPQQAPARENRKKDADSEEKQERVKRRNE